jgi:hypothetical protein
MRSILLATAIFCASIAWGRDCANAETAADKSICSNAKLRTGFEKASLQWDDLWARHLLDQPEYNQFRTAWETDAQACGQESSVEGCLERVLAESNVFIRCERIAKRLDRLPPAARQGLAKLPPAAFNGLRTQTLLELHPVVAPLAASVIGRDWLSWVESATPAPGDEVELVSGGRWVIGRGWMVANSLRREIWIAIDRIDCQLWIARFEQYGEQGKPEIRWASTAPGWPPAVAKLLAENGLSWDPALRKQVGLPATKVHQ